MNCCFHDGLCCAWVQESSLSDQFAFDVFRWMEEPENATLRGAFELTVEKIIATSFEEIEIKEIDEEMEKKFRILSCVIQETIPKNKRAQMLKFLYEKDLVYKPFLLPAF